MSGVSRESEGSQSHSEEGTQNPTPSRRFIVHTKAKEMHHYHLNNYYFTYSLTLAHPCSFLCVCYPSRGQWCVCRGCGALGAALLESPPTNGPSIQFSSHRIAALALHQHQLENHICNNHKIVAYTYHRSQRFFIA